MTISRPPLGSEEDSQKPIEEEAVAGVDWKATIEPWRKATLAVLPIFLFTRIFFLAITYFGGVLFTVSNYSPQQVSLHSLLYNWSHWDARTYYLIATKGYYEFSKAAFFPLYPYLERFLSEFLHIDALLAGMCISNLAFLATLVVLYRFVETEFDSDTARRTAFYLSIYPTALFFFAAYSESLFLLFLLSSFYAMRRGAWWLAGVFGGLATLTRSIGLALLLIFLWEYVRQLYPLLRQAWSEKRWLLVLSKLSNLLAALLIPLGFGIFVFYLNKRFHDPLAFEHAQVWWHSGPTFPWVAIGQTLKSLLTVAPFTFAIPHEIIDLTSVFLFAVLLLLCFVGAERFSVSQWSLLFFGILAWVYPLFFPGIPTYGIASHPYDALPSLERYVLEIFPAFILLARLGRYPQVHRYYLLTAMALLTFFTLQFLTGHWTI